MTHRTPLLRALCAALALLLLLGAAGCSSLSQTLLTIDGHTVTRGMFNFFAVQSADWYLGNSASGALDPRQEINGSTVGELLIDRACKQLANEYAMLHLGAAEGYELDEEVYAAAREDLAASRKEYGDEALQSYFDLCRMSESDYVEIAAVFSLEDRIETALFGPGGKYYPSDAEVADLRADFEQNYYHAYCITIDRTNSSGEDQRSSAEEIRALMADPEADLEAVSNTYSVTASADSDDDAYIRVSDDTDEAIVRALRATPVGGVSEVVAADAYYLVFAVLEKDDAYVEDTLAANKASETMNALLDAALDEMEIVETRAFKNYDIEDVL